MAPGEARGHLPPPFSLSVSVAHAAGLDDDLAARRVNPLSHHTTVGAAVGVIFRPVVAVTVSRPHAETERPDLHAGAAGVRAQIDLGGCGNRYDKRSSGCRGKCEFPHRVLLSLPVFRGQRLPDGGVARAIKIFTLLEPKAFLAPPALGGGNCGVYPSLERESGRGEGASRYGRSHPRHRGERLRRLGDRERGSRGG